MHSLLSGHSCGMADLQGRGVFAARPLPHTIETAAAAGGLLASGHHAHVLLCGRLGTILQMLS